MLTPSPRPFSLACEPALLDRTEVPEWGHCAGQATNCGGATQALPKPQQTFLWPGLSHPQAQAQGKG